MSARFSDFLAEPSSLVDDREDEIWDEYAPQETDGSRLHDEEGGKKYRLVFSRHAETIRLSADHFDPEIAQVIEQSRNILSLEDDWDEEGSPGYEESTWSRATTLISDLANRYWQATNIWVCPPDIIPGPEGSIDIHWGTLNRELLINVPPNSETSAGYFGSGDSRDSVKGKLDTSLDNHWILMWLLR